MAHRMEPPGASGSEPGAFPKGSQRYLDARRSRCYLIYKGGHTMKSFSLSIPYILLPLIISTAAVAQDTTGRLSGKNQDTCSSLISAVSLSATVTSVSSSIHQNTYIYDDFDFSQPFQHNKGGTATHAVNPSDKANTVIIDPYQGSIPIDRRGKFVKNPEMPQASSPHPQAATLP